MPFSGRNKRKIINDPVHGFINIPFDFVLDLIEHPYFQRMQRIRQLGLTSYVYPGASHTRLQHALGAMHLMGQAIQVIRQKGHEITDEEAEAVTVAILMHDCGHGPFSHALEKTIAEGIHHEVLSRIMMEQLDKDFGGRMTLALKIFTGQYHKRFLHQLVSSQLDMDRLDYLKRDSFFTGVTEGVIGSDRIIKMLNVVDDNLVVEAKGIYSIEKFLIARRLMYWQVYFHKTVLSAEKMLYLALKRARDLADMNVDLFCTPSLHFFLYFRRNKPETFTLEALGKKELIDHFALLDDSDILASLKVWQDHPDKILSLLATHIINRKLFRVKLQNEPVSEKELNLLGSRTIQMYGIRPEELPYLLAYETISNNAYDAKDENIKILFNDGTIRDIAEASDMLNISVLSKVIQKHFLCYPKEVDSTQ